jgi:hypothetical protein
LLKASQGRVIQGLCLWVHKGFEIQAFSGPTSDGKPHYSAIVISAPEAGTYTISLTTSGGFIAHIASFSVPAQQAKNDDALNNRIKISGLC